MRDILEKIIALFCIIVFLTFLINHGHIDFSGVDWVVGKTKEVAQSEQGQAYIEETKEISKNVFADLFNGVKSLFSSDDDKSSSNNNRSAIVLSEGSLVSVINEKTLEVKIGGKNETVKMIGLSALEDSNKESAITYLENITENIDTVYLEYDAMKKDEDGNYLAYVWIDNTPSEPGKEMLNGIMLEKGYAVDTVILPNNKYSDLFTEYKNEAKSNKDGFWGE